MVCMTCYKMMKDPDLDRTYEGPMFDGLTTILFKFNSKKGSGHRHYHLFNGLDKKPLCEEKSSKFEPFSYERSPKLRVLNKNEHSVFDLLKFSTSRLTKAISKDYSGELKPNQFVIGGSFALHYFLEGKVGWKYQDIDVFFLGRTSLNKFKIRASLLHHIFGRIKKNSWVCKFAGIDVHPPMDFVRTNVGTLKEFVEAIDISITGIFIVHSSMDIGDLIEIGDVPEMEGWKLVGTRQAVDDVKARRLVYYRQPEDELFSRCLERVAKYCDRGFRTVIHEPKKIPPVLGYGRED
jgi:hypothetical protein